MILVTGGAGYIGSHTVRRLLDDGRQVVAADNLIYGHRQAVDARAVFVHADLADKYSLQRLFATYPIEAVVHFAAFAYVGESMAEPEKYYLNNVAGSLNLLAAMRAAGVGKIVFSSSCATFGEPAYLPIDESHPQNPLNPYGRSKLAVEKILADYHRAYGLKYIALRYFNAAGAAADGNLGESHRPETHLIPLVLQALAGRDKSIKIFGNDYDTQDGTCVRDYVHVEDLAEAHRLALEKTDVFCGCLNLGTGVGASVKEIIAAAEEVTGRLCPTEYAPRRPGDPARLTADNKKAAQVLGWRPRHTDIREIIRTAWNWETNRKY